MRAACRVPRAARSRCGRLSRENLNGGLRPKHALFWLRRKKSCGTGVNFVQPSPCADPP
jgi:hypothetical protein